MKNLQKFFNLISAFKKWVAHNLRSVFNFVLYSIFFIISYSIVILMYLNNVWIIVFKTVFHKLNELKLYLAPKGLVILVFILLMIFTTITLAGIFPTIHDFEASLFVKELSFTYTGKQSKKPFLYAIRGIKKISGAGNQILTLTGKFKIESCPSNKCQQLNELLNGINELKIELLQPDSQWIISSASPKKNYLDLAELSLEPSTKIVGLKYIQSGHILSLCLKPDTLEDLCLQSEDNNNQVEQSKKSLSNQLAQLRLNPGRKLLKLSLERYHLPQLNLPEDLENTETIEFYFNSSQIVMPLMQTLTLSMELPDPAQNESDQWIQDSLDVKNVEFQYLEKIGNEVYKSTILSGKVKMAEKSLDIDENQFLIVEDPGIKLIRHIQISPVKDPELKVSGGKVQMTKPQQGLEVRLSGKTKLIQVGLDKHFPVANIRASWLDLLLPRDAIIAIIPSCTAIISYLLYWLVEYFSKSKNIS